MTEQNEVWTRPAHVERAAQWLEWLRATGWEARLDFRGEVVLVTVDPRAAHTDDLDRADGRDELYENYPAIKYVLRAQREFGPDWRTKLGLPTTIPPPGH